MSGTSTETNGLSVLMMTEIEREERADFRCLDFNAINTFAISKGLIETCHLIKACLYMPVYT